MSQENTIKKHHWDRVHQENGKWYFWDESDADREGPYNTEAEAREAFRKYCYYLRYRD